MPGSALLVRVLFIKKDFFPHYGVLCLASAVRKAGHCCELVITDIDALEEVLQEFHPDVVALSLTSGQVRWARETALHVKSNCGEDVHVVAGGSHPTFFPEIALESWCDSVSRGEADLSFPLLLKALESHSSLDSVPNLVYARGDRLHYTQIEVPSSLDSLPFPAYHLMRKYETYNRMGHLTALLSRGCPFNCSFCYAPAFRRLYGLSGFAFFRRKAPKLAVEEMSYASHLFPDVKAIKFNDDTFAVPPDSWLEEFAWLYSEEVGLPFNCRTRADIITERNAALLRQAGCNAVKFGLESGDDTIRNTVYQKGLSIESVRSAVISLQKAGLLAISTNVIGGPGESIEQALQTYACNLSLKVDSADCAGFHLYPGSPLAGDDAHLTYDSEYFLFGGKQGGGAREFENLVCLFPLAVALRIPPNLLSCLVRAPRNPLYKALLWAGQGLTEMKMGGMRLSNLVRLRVFARRFFNLPSLFLPSDFSKHSL